MRSDEGRGEHEFRLELPDADLETADAWLDCGTILARSAMGLLEELRLDLTSCFLGQLDDAAYDLSELVEAIILWIGWESPLIPDDRVRVELRDPTRHLQCEYLVESNEIYNLLVV